MASPSREKTKPKLPVYQLCILAVVRIAEPLALTSVFPYLPEMIKSFGVSRDEVAKWAGITSAIFSISQSMTAVLWGRTSDTIGRKPTLMLGITCTMICFLFWGTATSLAMAITIRAIQGCGNGNVGIIRTVVAELVPEKSLQPVAFSIMPMVWSVGSVFGPAFGGFFARPAEQFPAIFGNSKLLIKYPFLLPNLIACVFFLCSLVTAALFLRETLESKRHRKDWGLIAGQKIARLFGGKKATSGLQVRGRSHSRVQRSLGDDETNAPLLASMQDGEDGEDVDYSPDGLTPPVANRQHAHADTPSLKKAPKASAYEHIFNRQTSIVLLCYTLLALHSVAYDQVVPVFLNYPTQIRDDTNTKLPFKFSGGFDMTSGHIGTMFTITALISGVVQFLVFPPLCSHFGVLKCYRAASIASPLVYFLTPYTVLITNEKLRLFLFMVSFVVKSCIGIVTFPCVTIILTNSAPSMSVLGTLNGFATTVSGVGRAVGPAMTGAAFTWGVQRGYIITGWWLLAIIATIAAVPPFFITQGAGFNQPASAEGDEAGNDNNYDGCDLDDDFEEALLPSIEDEEDDIVGHIARLPEEALPAPATSLFETAANAESPCPPKTMTAQLTELPVLVEPEDPGSSTDEDVNRAAVEEEEVPLSSVAKSDGK